MRIPRRKRSFATGLSIFMICCAALSGCAHWPVVAAAGLLAAAPVLDNIHIEEPWRVPLAQAQAVADSCSIAAAGVDLSGRPFTRDGDWDPQADAYRFNYTYGIGPRGLDEVIIPIEVSGDGQARMNVWCVGDPYFEYGEDPARYRFPVGPREAADIALRAGLRDVPGPLRVRPAGEWGPCRLVWRAERYVAEGAYYDTVDVDVKTGHARRYRNQVGRSQQWHTNQAAAADKI
ncbi:MAG: hypothetical protein IPI48_11450 [bacterium]|nr:hypothetical protein [bacterium]